jgi:hypothetical protein
MQARVGFALASYGTKHRDAAVRVMKELAARLAPSARLGGVVVDNAMSGPIELELDSATTCISGDNSGREFSAWDRGLAWLERAYGPIETLILGNDTLHRSYGDAYVEGFTAERYRRAMREEGLLGWLDAYPRPITLFGNSLPRWVRTSLLVAGGSVIDRLRPFVLPYADCEIFSSDVRELFRTPSPLSENYRQYLRTWLFGEPGFTEFHERWHSAEPLSSTNFEHFRGKIRSILCEHHFSARAHALGIPLFDVR